MTERKQPLTAEQQELMQNPIDRWGQEWRKFMQTHYPEEISTIYFSTELLISKLL